MITTWLGVKLTLGPIAPYFHDQTPPVRRDVDFELWRSESVNRANGSL